MKSRARIAALVAPLLIAALPVVGTTATATTLNGGTETFTFGEDVENGRASIPVTNDTKTLVCDFVVKLLDSQHPAPPPPPPPAVGPPPPAPPPILIEDILLDDPNHGPPGPGPENWDVADDNNGDLEAGESDDSPPAPAVKVRIQERGKDHCLARGRTGSLEIKFSGGNPKKGDRIAISPTSWHRGVIYAVALPVGCAVAQADNMLFAAGEISVTNNSGVAMSSFPVSTNWGVEVEEMSSPTHGGYFDKYGQSYITDKPIGPEDVMALVFELSGFNPDGPTTSLCLGEMGDVQPVDIQSLKPEQH